MSYLNDVLEAAQVYNRLADQESRLLYEARLNYLLTGEAEEFYKLLDKVDRKYRCNELDKMMKENPECKKLIVMGISKEAKRIKRILDRCEMPIAFFCDEGASEKKKTIDGVSAISVKELVEEHLDSIVILSEYSSYYDMYNQLLVNGYPRRQILYPMQIEFIAETGIQYFDLFGPEKDEIFIDAGSYDGSTLVDFMDWSKRDYKKIYAFEANDDMNEIIQKKIDEYDMKNIEIVCKAVWKKEGTLRFHFNGAGSNIVSGSKEKEMEKDKDKILKVPAIDIDSVVKEDKVTFIKMDVEGSEINALKGAKNTIRKNKPKLAISIYHKPDDILSIPAYLMKLVPEYKFYIRQYNSNLWETVLYACV